MLTSKYMQPLNKYIFLSYKKEKEKKGILLSDVSRNKPSICVVIEVGDLVEKIKKDDQVVINPFDLREIQIEDKKLYYLEEDEILAKL